MSNLLKIIKTVGSLPGVLEPNGLYFVKETDGTYTYLANSSGTDAVKLTANSIKPNETQVVACSGEKALLALETSVVTFRVVGNRTLLNVRASLTEGPVGSGVTLDIKKNGVSVLSPKLTIDATKKTSVGSISNASVITSNFSDDSEITIDITQIGTSSPGKGLKVYLTWSGV